MDARRGYFGAFWLSAAAALVFSCAPAPAGSLSGEATAANGAPAGADPGGKGAAPHPQSGARKEASCDFPIIPRRRIRSNATTAQIFQLDGTPVNGRRVLLLVHGGGAEKRPYFRWKKVLKALNADPEIPGRFKIYLYRYNTDARLTETAPAFQKDILRLKAATGVNEVSLMCLSMGGNLVQRALMDPAVDAAVDLVFAMCCPFHGSPLFSSAWFQYSLDSTPLMPWARPIHNLDYLLYFSRHKTLQQDLRWDNFDDLIPRVGRFKEGGLGPRGDLTPGTMDNPELAAINASGRINKTKFVTYGGYLVNIYIMPPWRRRLEKTILAPYRYVTVKLPVQLGREHPALRMLNKELSNMAINPDAPIYGPPSPHSFVLNDGITPVSSALYLSPELIKENPMLLEADLPALHGATDVHLARVFRNLDHISFLDGRPPNKVPWPKVSDMIHPEDGKKRLFDFLVDDLKNYRLDSAAAHAIPAPRGVN